LHVRTGPVLLCKAATGGLLAAQAPWWAVLPVVVLTAHFMHACLIAFHEAAHRNVAPSKWYNDAVGLLVGAFAFMSLTLYRAVHRTHHARLGAPEDDELWPFNRPAAPRALRVAAAASELCVGIVFTPLLFLRAFLRPGTAVTDPATRRRVWAEFALIAVVWSAVLGVTAANGLWLNFLMGTLIPAILAGNVQSWRKYVEHVGLTARGQAGGTRSVDAPGPVGRLLSDLMLHEPYHGVHHRFAALPRRPSGARCRRPTRTTPGSCSCSRAIGPRRPTCCGACPTRKWADSGLRPPGRRPWGRLKALIHQRLAGPGRRPSRSARHRSRRRCAGTVWRSRTSQTRHPGDRRREQPFCRRRVYAPGPPPASPPKNLTFA